MRRRRRYEVVVEGLAGQAASHRSVVSEHRTEEEAREAAGVEADRLGVIYGEAASAWRVVVTRDDEVVGEERPAAGPDAEVRRDVPPAVEWSEAIPREEIEAAERERAPEPEPEGPVPDWVIERFEKSIARRDEREDVPPA
jgi:hypothetical protein